MQRAESSPRIAVVVPCYNDGRTIGETIRSVESQDEPCDLVVVDDGSTDELTLQTFGELERRGVRVLHQENGGPSAARMAGLAATVSPYVLSLDADDLLFGPSVLSQLGDALDADPDAAAVWGDTEVFGERSIYQRGARRLDPWRITYFNGLPASSLFRRTALEAVGGWQLRGGYGDWDLWMALAERGFRGRYVPIPVMRYRVAGDRMWANALRHHGQIYAELRRRHRPLFERRWENWRASREPWRVKLLMPLIGALPLLSVSNRRRLYALVDRPRRAPAMLRQRLARITR